jgi:FkbM family methyltransferase
VKAALFKDTTQGEFPAVWPVIRAHPHKLVVDVGANDGFTDSLSWPFIARGWKGILFEPHPKAFLELRRRHGTKKQCVLLNMACADFVGEAALFEGKFGAAGTSTISNESDPWLDQVRSSVSYKVRVVRLRDILLSQNVPAEFGLLAIDAEHMDYEVLVGAELGMVYRPKVIITEDTGFERDQLKYDYLRKCGYRLFAKIKANSVWRAKL